MEDLQKMQIVTQEVAIIVEESRAVKITSDMGMQQASSLLKAVKEKYRAVEELRKYLKAPVLEQAKRIDEQFREPLDKLLQAEKAIKSAMLIYDTEQTRLREEAQRKANEIARLQAEKERQRLERQAQKAEDKGKTEKAEELREAIEQVFAAPMVVVPSPTPAGITYREVWKADIIDVNAIPMEWMIPNIEGINAFARSTKGTVQIPGVRIYPEKVVASR